MTVVENSYPAVLSIPVKIDMNIFCAGSDTVINDICNS